MFGIQLFVSFRRWNCFWKWIIVYFIVRDRTATSAAAEKLHSFAFCQRYFVVVRLTYVLISVERQWQADRWIVQVFQIVVAVVFNFKISMINRLKCMIYSVCHWRVWHSQKHTKLAHSHTVLGVVCELTLLLYRELDEIRFFRRHKIPYNWWKISKFSEFG